jgi:hypothetical protein
MRLRNLRPPGSTAETVSSGVMRRALAGPRGSTADGQTHKFWERNLRLKTDASGDGPEKNAPALVRAGMMGDRADLIFADPTEISPRITNGC